MLPDSTAPRHASSFDLLRHTTPGHRAAPRIPALIPYACLACCLPAQPGLLCAFFTLFLLTSASPHRPTATPLLAALIPLASVGVAGIVVVYPPPPEVGRPSLTPPPSESTIPGGTIVIHDCGDASSRMCPVSGLCVPYARVPLPGGGEDLRHPCPQGCPNGTFQCGGRCKAAEDCSSAIILWAANGLSQRFATAPDTIRIAQPVEDDERAPQDGDLVAKKIPIPPESLVLTTNGQKVLVSMRTTSVRYKGYAYTEVDDVRNVMSLMQGALRREQTHVILLSLYGAGVPGGFDAATSHLEILSDLRCEDDPLQLLRDGYGGCAAFAPLGCETTFPSEALRSSTVFSIAYVCIASCGACPASLPFQPPENPCSDITQCFDYLTEHGPSGCPSKHETWEKSTCYVRRFCPTVKKILDEMCFPDRDGGEAHRKPCLESQSAALLEERIPGFREDSPPPPTEVPPHRVWGRYGELLAGKPAARKPRIPSCINQGIHWNPLQTDASAGVSWCTDRATGMPRTGTAVPLSEAPRLTCHVPPTSIAGCWHREPPFPTYPLYQIPCTDPGYMSFPIDVYRIIQVYNVTVTLSKYIENQVRGQLRKEVENLLPVSRMVFSWDSRGGTSVTIEPSELEVRSRSYQLTDRPQGVLSSDVVARQNLRLTKSSLLLAMEIGFTLESIVNRNPFRYGNVTDTSWASHGHAMFVDNRQTSYSNLVADFGPTIGKIFIWGADTAPLERRNAVNSSPGSFIRLDLEERFASSTLENGVTWGVYTARQDGSCPLPDDNVYDPMELGRRPACVDATAPASSPHCRVGDFHLKHGRLRSGRFGQLADRSLPPAGWASVAGKLLVLGTTPPICATILPIAGNASELLANFSDPDAQQQGDFRHRRDGDMAVHPRISGTLRVSQAAGSRDTIIFADIHSTTPVSDVTFHISSKGIEEFSGGSCIEGYHPDTDIYDPFGAVEGWRKDTHRPRPTPEQCLGFHPAVDSYDSGCPLGDLTPQLRSLRDLPSVGTAVHPNLDVSGAVPALRPDRFANTRPGGLARQSWVPPTGKTVVLLHRGRPIACAPLLGEDDRAGSVRGATGPPRKMVQDDTASQVGYILGATAGALLVAIGAWFCHSGNVPAVQQQGTAGNAANGAGGVPAPAPAPPPPPPHPTHSTSHPPVAGSKLLGVIVRIIRQGQGATRKALIGP